MSSVLISILFSLAILKATSAIPCPFDNNMRCDCSGNGSPTTFKTATCSLQNGTLNQFTGSRATYNITDELIIQTYANIDSNTANIFTAFGYIAKVSFTVINVDNPLRLNLAPGAFYDGQQVDAFSLTGFSQVFPLIPGIQTLGKNGLKKLEIRLAAGEALGPHEFSAFPKLTTLILNNTQISSIDDAAFADLANTLTELRLVAIWQTTYPSIAISALTKLQVLDLSKNNILAIPANAFSTLTELRELRYTQNPNQGAVDIGAFDKLPATLQALYLDGGDLVAVPTRVLSSLSELTTLSLAYNIIAELKKDDLSKNGKLVSLDLSGNLVGNIQDGFFDSLKNVVHFGLGRTALKSFDLSLLDGMTGLEELALDKQFTAKFDVTDTDPAHVPSSIRTITFKSTQLTRLDPVFERIASGPKFQSLDISNDFRMTCDDSLNWIAKYALCPTSDKKVFIDYSVCANLDNKPLSDYLQEAVQNPCQQ